MRKLLTAYFFLVNFFVYDTATGHPLSDNFADLVENKSPSVVNVFTVQKPKQTFGRVQNVIMETVAGLILVSWQLILRIQF